MLLGPTSDKENYYFEFPMPRKYYYYTNFVSFYWSNVFLPPYFMCGMLQVTNNYNDLKNILFT